MRFNNKIKGRQITNDHIRINLAIHGEPARFLQDLKSRGLIASWRQGIIRALEALRRDFVDRELRAAQLKNLSKANENGAAE